MDQKQQILHHYRVDEDGLREISRKVGVDRKTVLRKACFPQMKNLQELALEELLFNGF